MLKFKYSYEECLACTYCKNGRITTHAILGPVLAFDRCPAGAKTPQLGMRYAVPCTYFKEKQPDDDIEC